jgi:hypothetical protein
MSLWDLYPFLESRGNGVSERERESDFERGEILRRGERERESDRERERDGGLSAARAEGGVCDRLLDRPREGGRDTISCRRGDDLEMEPVPSRSTRSGGKALGSLTLC